MKLKSGFVVQKVGNSFLAVAIGERAEQYNARIRMNSTGAFLWKLLAEGEKTHGELLSAMLTEYDVPEDVAKRDILAFESELRRGGLLDE